MAGIFAPHVVIHFIDINNIYVDQAAFTYWKV